MFQLARWSFTLTTIAVVMVGFATAGFAQESKQVPWLSEIQDVPESRPAEAPPLKPLLIDAQGNPITTPEVWNERRELVRRQWLDFLGSLDLPENARPELEVIAEDRDAGVLRQLVRYEIEPGLKTEAYLIKPIDGQGKYPAVAVFHSTVNHSIRQPAGLAPDTQKAFGLKLAQRGFVTFSPRNFLWPTSEQIAANEETKLFQARHPRAKGMAKMLFDARIAVNILTGLEEVDADRIGAVGHSLGAKEALYLPAFDDRVKVAVSSEGGVGTTFSNWDAPWYLGSSIKDPAFEHEHHELLGLIAPRAFLLIGGDSADGERGWPFIEAALPVYRLYDKQPRFGMFNHRGGHAVPPIAEERIYEWFETYLK